MADSQSIFDILNLSWRRSTYYTCELQDKKWHCTKGTKGDNVFKVREGLEQEDLSDKLWYPIKIEK